MNTQEILQQLEKMGSQSIKNVLMKHGAREPFFGVKVEDLKKIQKKIKKDYQTSLELFDTGISDAMYLAGLIADETKMTKKDLQKWAKNAYWSMISEYSVAWVTAESRYGWELALEWIESKQENIACSGWCTLSSIVSLKTSDELDLKKFKSLLDRVAKEIHTAPNRVRYCMNGFVINAGGYLKELTEHSLKIGKQVGKVSVEMGGTACKVPYSPEYIQKMIARGMQEKKRKSARC